jgi:exodeoxyribonuclease VII large subunit
MKTNDVAHRSHAHVLGFSPEAPIPVGRAARRLRKVVCSAIGRSLWLCGELTDLRRDMAGNTRFALQEAGCRLACIIWARDASRDTRSLENGMRLAVQAQLGVYEGDTRIQATVTAVRLDGDGQTKRELERVRRRLQRDGLFDPRRKRPMPPYPRGVAVITSRTGAALQDIFAVARRRHPGVPIFLVPSVVQGTGAAPSLIRALGLAQRAEACDVIIMARGGGSPSDLAVFNDEPLARAIAACRIPVVTAIGHETDVLIADEVADLRAGTASIAAERVFPERRVLAGSLVHTCERLRNTLRSRLTRAAARRDLLRAAIGPAINDRMLRQHARLARAGEQLPQRITLRVQRSRTELHRSAVELNRLTARRAARERARLERLAAAISALNPTSVLSRGYAILSDERGRVVSSVAEARSATKLVIRMHDGDFMLDVPRSR